MGRLDVYADERAKGMGTLSSDCANARRIWVDSRLPSREELPGFWLDHIRWCIDFKVMMCVEIMDAYQL